MLRAAVVLHRATADHAGVRAAPFDSRVPNDGRRVTAADLDRAQNEFAAAVEDYLRTRG